MCGLLGLLTARGDAPDRAAAVTSALRCARHRGPDETGELHDQDVVLGFNRLSIIDLDHSHQPLRYRDRYTLVFNGEIYNYLELRAELIAEHGAEFSTEGDSEVIVAAYHHWGADAVRRLRGMFAFLIWDAEQRVLFGARDPFGIKPLFTMTGPGGTAFSSEKKSLEQLTPVLAGCPATLTLDEPALQHYLLMQYVPEPATTHREIRRIESGTMFTVRPGAELVTERYFTPVFSATPVLGAARDGLYQRIADTLRDSVAKHMRADVTVGAFLSGGIDSTAIAALAKEHNPNLITFTTGFDREGYSEVDVAAESAAAIGVRHVVRTVKPDEMMEALPLIIWYLDDPVADPALVPLWFVAREARQHVKVVLSGEGADELFGGYTIYREPLSLAPFEKVPDGMRKAMGRLSTRIPEGVRGKDLLRRGALGLEERYYGNARIFREEQLASILRRYDPRRSHTEITAQWYRASAGWDPVARMQHVDLFTWLRGDILVKADKMTMANSLELRVPFLDPEVFAVAAGIPLGEKITGTNVSGTTKYALRKALEGIVPPHVLHRRKLGFPVPIRHWLRDEMYEWAAGIIRDSQTDHLLDLAAVRRMLDEHRAGPVDHSRRIWTLLVFMIWHGITVERRITPEIPEPHYPVAL